MSTRIRTFLKRPKYSFYPDCGFGDRIHWFRVDEIEAYLCKKRTIWLFYRTDTNARGFWLQANARLKNRHAGELSRNQSILRFDATLQHDWPIEQCLLYIRVFSRENEEAMFWSFHPLTDKTNNENLPKPFFKVKRKSLYAEVKPSLHFCSNSFFISMNYTNWTFCLKTIHYSFCYSARLRAVPLQSVETKLGRTGESKMAERETPDFPRLLVFYFCSLCLISSLSWPSWGTARSLLFCWTR